MIKSDNLKLTNINETLIVTFPHFEKVEFISHAFSTRLGGASGGKYSTYNFSFTNGDDQNAVLENYKRICSVLEVDYKKCVLSHQTHTTNIRIVKQEDIGKGIVKERDYNDVDGLITNIPGAVLVTQYADCVPLLFVDTKNKVIAASHGGWRGTVNGIAEKTVRLMQEHFNSNPKYILVGIAPSIKQCCFEVDKPVYDEFKKIDGINIDEIAIEKPNGKYNIDLQKTNRLILENAGVPIENIVVSDLCTKCNSEYFHSHRATNGERGNMAAFIAIKE